MHPRLERRLEIDEPFSQPLLLQFPSPPIVEGRPTLPRIRRIGTAPAARAILIVLGGKTLAVVARVRGPNLPSPQRRSGPRRGSGDRRHRLRARRRAVGR